MKKVNILGKPYKIIEDNATKNSKLVNADAYVEFFSKEIVIDKTLEVSQYNTIKRLDLYKQKVLRHEIIHAYLYESGLGDLAKNEEIVDWIAIQFPRLKETFIKLGIEE